MLLVGLFATASAVVLTASAGNVGPLQLAQTIPLSEIDGRIDHFSIDVQGKRAFLAALAKNTIEKFGEAVDQLLGYTSWRDTKTAILVFNRGTETSTVVAGVDSVMKSHSNFKRTVEWRHESGLRYVFHQPGDKNRELIVSAMVFHIPTLGDSVS